MLIKCLRLLWLGLAYAHDHSHYAHERGRFHHPPVQRDMVQPYIGTRLLGTIDVLAPPVLVGDTPALPPGSPQPAPSYMKDNVNNFFGSTPDHGSMTGPVLGPVNSTVNGERHGLILAAKVSSDDYWLSSLGRAGSMPFASAGYQFFRNVKDFGAVGDGVTDNTAAISQAVAAFSSSDHSTLRCGEKCGSTSALGAVVYFPAGTYPISTPIVQYYYTQFVGNPTLKPVIKGAKNFTGIALVDTDFYIPGGNGAE
ncbi:hypothetical protein IFM58399_09743 [Aspergillus lentulus]|uniref:Rhamnogalacturonase A/B/Epimerase-like pectate lyase domain-containing protein n=1 Tax=Aspergillus lentulus TaxID=293939 RepID=A0ABQ1B3X0_ASPLE|nr:uncharacterized protein IFM58399_09743 [Aspergillus lentulus]KAF4152018.1 hypothetical protein CNMCM6069_002747 [Aspergillus lentulus]GFF54115.1 hypothetical protein IFM58399_09743 [Aspergillus lentulus]GFF78983.1 hypothetical protein IFM62136_09952 [Aspergillus lentulus]GFF93282.1 hypothetical protein IFM60648_10032 [Aspergillus lentulus]GFF96228.1 hypothetical protein IFM47457_10770 [Aspergillus lentulus]